MKLDSENHNTSAQCSSAVPSRHRNYRWIQQKIGNLGHPLGSLLGEQLFPGLGLGLRLGAHDATSPLLPDLVKLVVEVCLEYNLSHFKRDHNHTIPIRPQYAILSYLNSLQDLAELKLVLVLDSGKAQHGCGLLVNNLCTIICTVSAFIFRQPLIM